MPKALTAKQIEKFQPRPMRYDVPDGLVPGLFLTVYESGARTWVVRYRHGGKTRKLTLAPYPLLSLAEAREKARVALRRAAEGLDPAGEKQAARAAAADPSGHVGALLDRFYRQHVERNNSPRTAGEVKRTLDKDFRPVFGERRIQDVTRRDIIGWIDAIAERAPTHANRCLSYGRKFGNWCVEKSILEISPFDRVKPPTIEQSRDRILSDAELRLVWLASGRLDYPFREFVRLLLLTGQRRSEVSGLRWSEIRNDLWTIPASRSKNGIATDVPLSDAAQAVIGSIPRMAHSAYALTTTGKSGISGYSKAKARLDRIMVEIASAEAGEPVAIPDWRLHDLRRSVASGLARLGTRIEIIEAVLNHRGGAISGVAAIYVRHDFAVEKRAALDGWATFVIGLAEGPRVSTVVPLRA